MAFSLFISDDNKIHRSDTGAPLALAALVASQGAFTQTYSTADSTVPAATALAVDATAATSSTPFGYSETQANEIVASTNALVADVLANRKLINQIIDVLQGAGLAT